LYKSIWLKWIRLKSGNCKVISAEILNLGMHDESELGFKIPRRVIISIILVTSFVRIHPSQQKVKHHFQFQVYYVC